MTRRFARWTPRAIVWYAVACSGRSAAGSAPVLGTGCRRFESGRPDHRSPPLRGVGNVRRRHPETEQRGRSVAVTRNPSKIASWGSNPPARSAFPDGSVAQRQSRLLITARFWVRIPADPKANDCTARTPGAPGKDRESSLFPFLALLAFQLLFALTRFRSRGGQRQFLLEQHREHLIRLRAADQLAVEEEGWRAANPQRLHGTIIIHDVLLRGARL